MKLRTQRTRGISGIALVECIFYIGMLAFLMTVGYSVFYRGWENSYSLRRNSEQLARALTVGEQWREDLRTATGLPLQPITNGATGEQWLDIPEKGHVVEYRFANNSIWRRTNPDAAWTEMLGLVKSSRIVSDPRRYVTAWRWELELKNREKRRIQPLLTFEGVVRTPAQNLNTLP
jgi:hypothetical protein